MDGVDTLDAPLGLRASRFAVDGEEFLVLSYDLGDPALPSILTRAERDVASALIRGRATMEIAIARSTSPRTVANQIRSVYCKLRVQCRLELAALLCKQVP